MCVRYACVGFFTLKHYCSLLSLHHNKERSKVSHFYSYSYVHVHTRTHNRIIFNQVWNCSHAWIKLWVDFEHTGVVYISLVGYYTLFSSFFSGFVIKLIRLREIGPVWNVYYTILYCICFWHIYGDLKKMNVKKTFFWIWNENKEKKWKQGVQTMYCTRQGIILGSVCLLEMNIRW